MERLFEIERELTDPAKVYTWTERDDELFTEMMELTRKLVQPQEIIDHDANI